MKPQESGTYDEVIIPQEAQIAPAIVLKIETRNLAQLEKRFHCPERRIMNTSSEIIFRDDSEAISLSESLLS